MTAVLIAALSLSSCGDADDYAETGEIRLTTSTGSVVFNEDIILRVETTFPPPVASISRTIIPQCEPTLDYRAQGDRFNKNWTRVPGSGATRIFSFRADRPGTIAVLVRGKCTGSNEDWKYSNSVDITVAEPPEPEPEEITQPSTPSGPPDLALNTNGTFTTAGSVSTFGHTLEYEWTAAGGTISPPGWQEPKTVQIKWSTSGSKIVYVKARCKDHPLIQSTASDSWTVTIP